MSKRLINKISLTVLLVMVTFVHCYAWVEHTKKPKELPSLISSGNAIVLFRIKPVFKMNYYVTTYYTYFRAKIQSVYGGQVAKIMPFTPDPLAEIRGWLYITLPPGAYSINLMFSRGLGGGDELWPSYTIDIPKGKPIVYIGSFKMQCEGARPTGLPIPVAPADTIWSCRSPVDMIDEASEALEISKTYFNQYGPPAISLAQRK